MSFSEYLGRFHPALVHLPIGFLLAAILLEWISYKKEFRRLRNAVPVLFFFGFIAAVFSAFTGYLLSRSGEYDSNILNLHQWLGIAVAMLSFVSFLIVRNKELRKQLPYRMIIGLLAILIVLTGHFGGTLSRGEGYLTPDFTASALPRSDFSIVSDSAVLYTDLIAPVLDKKCKSCHGPSRQKGKLRLDQPEYILAGGKNGSILSSDKSKNSELINRIHLTMSDKDHMPPKEKPQLDEQEVMLISYWVKTGADFKLKIGALPGVDSLRGIFKKMPDDKKVNDDTDVPSPSVKVLSELEKGGVVVSQLAENNGYVSVSFQHADSSKSSLLIKAMLQISQQVKILKLSKVKLTHADWMHLNSLYALTRLGLDYSNVTDADIKAFAGLKRLEYLNLVGTQVSTSGLASLDNISTLRHVFLYRSGIQTSDLVVLRKSFRLTEFDFGAYKVSTLASDTLLVTKPYVIEK